MNISAEICMETMCYRDHGGQKQQAKKRREKETVQISHGNSSIHLHAIGDPSGFMIPLWF